MSYQEDRKKHLFSFFRLSDLEKTVYMLVGSISLLCMAVGILLSVVWKDETDVWYKLTYFFLSELGIAGVISLVIIFTIEAFTKNRHEEAAQKLINDINGNLFKAVFQRYIPDSVFNEVEKCLLCSDVLRTDYDIDYNLTYISPEEKGEYEINDNNYENYLWAHIRSSYNLTNLTEKHVKQPIEMHVELPIDECMQGFVKFTEVRINGRDFKEDEIDDCLKMTESHKIFCFKEEIPPGGQINIEISAETAKRKLDQEVWSSRLPSNGLELRVTAPKSIQVHATANHSQKLRKSEIKRAHSTIWKLESGIFPFQSVIFWWNAK